jgi:hypothetical protein
VLPRGTFRVTAQTAIALTQDSMHRLVNSAHSIRTIQPFAPDGIGIPRMYRKLESKAHQQPGLLNISEGSHDCSRLASLRWQFHRSYVALKSLFITRSAFRLAHPASSLAVAPDIDQCVSRQVAFDVDDAAASIKRGVIQLTRRFVDDNSCARAGIHADDQAMPMLNSTRVFTSNVFSGAAPLGIWTFPSSSFISFAVGVHGEFIALPLGQTASAKKGTAAISRRRFRVLDRILEV